MRFLKIKKLCFALSLIVIDVIPDLELYSIFLAHHVQSLWHIPRFLGLSYVYNQVISLLHVRFKKKKIRGDFFKTQIYSLWKLRCPSNEEYMYSLYMRMYIHVRVLFRK